MHIAPDRRDPKLCTNSRERFAFCLQVLLCLLWLLYCPVSHAQAGAFTNPIIPGDHPDPTVIRVGDTYWMTSTAGNWAPQFALYRSKDLHHWTAVSAVFPHTPGWAIGDFWAPELVQDHGRTLVYYVARIQGGVLCVAVATATSPQGPYTDHGPLVCQPDGSIDPSFARDEHGQPFLIWKEDGNSRGQPTPIWAQPLTPDLLHLTGTKTKLLVNDPDSWEGNVVEAPYIQRHAGQYFLFYAGSACCGVQCQYAEGVARANHLLGPWTKDPNNPIIRPNGNWRCPGHGTAVETRSGKDFLLYHAYPAAGNVYVGRESVLDPIDWGPDDWPTVNDGKGPAGGGAGPEAKSFAFSDTFRLPSLDPEWKWPLHREPSYTVAAGRLSVSASPDGGPVFLGRSLLAPEYEASVGVLATGTADEGLGILGDLHDLVILVRRGDKLEVLGENHGKEEVLWSGDAPEASTVWLRVNSAGRGKAAFSYSTDRSQWSNAGDPVDTSKLVPWDQGLRVGLVAAGTAGRRAVFTRFSLKAWQAPQ